MNVEDIRVILERTFQMPVAESDAQIVLDRINELRAAENPIGVTTSTNGTRCANCKSNYVRIGTSILTCAMCGSTRRA